MFHGMAVKSKLAVLLVCLAASASWIGAAGPTGETAHPPPAPDSSERVAELKQLRFGMFVCWSFSSFSGREWTPGVTNLDLFHLTGCDVEQ
jgi:hypothetical protein